MQSRIATNNYTKNFGYDFSNILTFRHKFKKPRRTISLGVSTDYNPKTNSGSLYSSNIYYQPDTSSILNIEDSHTQVLTSYYMLTATYIIKNFKNGATAPIETPERKEGGWQRGGVGNGGGMPPPPSGN